ncbi:MAG: phage portal protein [Lachnospiraceae bacterium]|nr:phage portal protein [Lachnospiraceae bacterium]
MGLFERIFGARQQTLKAKQTFELLDGYRPSFHSWQGSIFESDLIRAALDAHGRHAAKLSVNISGSAKPNLQSRLKVQPNQFQTWPQFLYRTAVVLYAKNTAFIVPVLGEYGETNGVITVVPQRWELVESEGVPYVRFHFAKNQRRAVELWNVGILTRYQMDNDLFGADNEALKATLDLIAMQKQGISEGIKNSATYRFMATSSNWSTDEDLAKERERFNSTNFRSGNGGVLLWPNTYKDIKQINQEAYKVDAEQMELIKNNVFDYFAVNEEIIQNKAYGDAWLAFYEGAIEWFSVQLSEAMTRMLFSERERSSFGNKIWFTSNRLQYMSNSDKLSAISQLADRGLMTRNELREILNLSPLPEPYGSQIPARGEYYDIKGPADPDDGGADNA